MIKIQVVSYTRVYFFIQPFKSGLGSTASEGRNPRSKVGKRESSKVTELLYPF